MRELGKRIRQRRVKAGLSLRELARRVGKSHAWLSNLEAGRMGEPRAEDLTAIAEQLGDAPEDYLRLAGRVNLAAARVVPAAEKMPAWATRLEAKLDALSDALVRVQDAQEVTGEELAEALGRLQELLARAGRPSADGHGHSSDTAPGAPRTNGTPT